MKKIPYGRHQIDDDDIEAVKRVLQSDFLTTGPSTAEFEQNFADYVGAKYAVAVANGTAALHIAALALNIKKGDRVITTPITFAASANCVLYCGGEVDFVDIDPDTFLMDLDALEEKLTSKPVGYYKGIIPVDFAGYPVNLERLKKIADTYNLWILEDACHAPGGYFIDSESTSQYCGNCNYSDVSIFSFHPVKHIAAGEGGMITTNDEKIYKRLKLLRTHGITKDPGQLHENHGGWYYEMQELGFNYRLTDFQSALGNSQLKKASAGLKRRHEIAQKYDTELSNISGLKLPKREKGIYHAFHLYVIQTSSRKELYDYLVSNQVFVQVHYIPVHTLPYYSEFGWEKGDFPIAEKYYSQCLSLPMFPALTDEEQDYVIDLIKTFFRDE